MSMYRARSWLVVLAIVMVAIAGAWLLKPVLQPATAPVLISAQQYPAGKPLAPFALLDHNGQRFDNSRLQGKWSFVFFGYTSCPDICPTTLAVFSQFYRQLPPELQQDTQLIFATVDPARDNVEKLARYVPFFHAELIGVTGDAAATDAFARDLGVAYAVVPQADGVDYLVDHSVRVFLLNPDGERHTLFSPSQGAAFVVNTVLADYQHLRASDSH